jgi:hemolysin activation/secretion protein
MRPALLAALAALGAASGAAAQSPETYLPSTGSDAAPEVEPPAQPPPPPPVAPDRDAPGFVLQGIDLNGATAIPAEDLAPLWTPLIGQPVTLATLEDLADRISAAYRARGYMLSQAMLPAQTVADGRVRILVVEGFVDRLEVEGGNPAQARRAGQLFAPVPDDRPLRLPTLERSVLLARDTLGGDVETVMAPSPTTFAAADLGVVLIPDPFTGFAAADNRGSRLFGPVTATAGASAYGLLGLNERIDGLVSVAPEPDSSLAFGQVVLDLPLPALDRTALDGGRLELRAEISRGDPDLARAGSPEDLTVTSNATELAAGLVVPFVRTRSQNLTGRAGIEWQSAESVTGFAGTESSSTDRLAVLDARLTWDIADRLGGVSLVDAGLRQGIDAFGAEIGASGPAAGVPDFTAATLTLSRLQRLGQGPWSVFVEATGQLAADVLPNAERFALGGAGIGRGFAPGNTTGDAGWGGLVELRRQLPALGPAIEAAELYAFADYGQAFDRTPERDGMEREDLGSVGIGARIDVRPWLTLTPELARQTVGVATDTDDDGLETRAYLGLVARF